jgi:hypothetical protein
MKVHYEVLNVNNHNYVTTSAWDAITMCFLHGITEIYEFRDNKIYTKHEYFEFMDVFRREEKFYRDLIKQ